MFLRNKMVKFSNTLSFRLTLWYASMFIVFLLVALLFSYLAINSILNKRMDDDLAEDIDEFRLLFSTSGLQPVLKEIEREAGSGNAETVFLRLLDKEGDTIFASDLEDWRGLEVDKELVKHVASMHAKPVLETQDIASQDYATRIIYGLIGPDTILQIGESLEEKAEIMELILAVFMLMFLLVLPVASGISWFVARKAAQGIEEVSRAAVEIRRGEFDRRVSVKAHTAEIQTLVDTFNSMAERIRNLIAEMREMIDNIAHDLRSPLARIRAIAETMITEGGSMENCHAAAADTIDECDRLIKLINTTLDVAEAEADVSYVAKEAVELSTMVEDACELFEPLAEKKRVSLSCRIEPDCRLQGNKQNLQRMLTNLLDNALKYTPANGEVTVSLVPATDQFSVIVADTGIGIPESDQRRVFDRFYRCDRSRSEDGCGLGLSFARAVARAHRGEINLTSAPNQGSTFIVTLPNSPV